MNERFLKKERERETGSQEGRRRREILGGRKEEGREGEGTGVRMGQLQGVVQDTEGQK